MKKIKPWSGMLILFLAGCIVGGVSARFLPVRETVRTSPCPEQKIEQAVIDKLQGELNLDAVQSVQVERIVCLARGEMRELREIYRPEREEIIDRSIEAVRAVLSSDQRRKLDAISEQLKERRLRTEEMYREKLNVRCE